MLHSCNPLACVFGKLLQAVIGFPQPAWEWFYLNHHEKHGSPAPTALLGMALRGLCFFQQALPFGLTNQQLLDTAGLVQTRVLATRMVRLVGSKLRPE